MRLVILVIAILALSASAAVAAPPALTGSISIDQPGPYHYGDFLTFTTTTSNLRWSHPMIEVACYQDENGDGVVTTDLFGGDLVYLVLDIPTRAFPLATGEGSAIDPSQPASCEARLLAYGWKGGQEYVTPLDSVEFTVDP
jgi:hypothetical protein